MEKKKKGIKQCWICREEIDRLDGQVESIIEATLERSDNFSPPTKFWDNASLSKAVSWKDDFWCPKCGETLFTNLKGAEEFLMINENQDTISSRVKEFRENRRVALNYLQETTEGTPEGETIRDSPTGWGHISL